MARKPYEDSVDAKVEILLDLRRVGSIPEDVIDSIGTEVQYAKDLRPSGWGPINGRTPHGWDLVNELLEFEWIDGNVEDLGKASMRIVEIAAKHLQKAGLLGVDALISTKVTFKGEFYYGI